MWVAQPPSQEPQAAAEKLTKLLFRIKSIVVVSPLALFESTAAAKTFLLSPEYILGIGFVLFVGLRIEESYKKKRDEKQADVFQEEHGDEVKNESGLKCKDLKVGDGKEAKSGDTVVVHYTGWLTDGTQFETSRGRKGIGQLLLELRSPFSFIPPGKRYGGILDGDRREPFSFRIDEDDVIPGWHQGIAGMRVGGKRRLFIPPELGYGAAGKGSVPANATLVFVVVLIDVIKGSEVELKTTQAEQSAAADRPREHGSSSHNVTLA